MESFYDSEYGKMQFLQISTQLNIKNSSSIAPSEMKQFLFNLLQFQKKRKFQIPIKFFWILEVEGPVSIILNISIFNLGSQFDSTIWTDSKYESHLSNLINLILNELEARNYWKRPAVFMASSVSFIDRERYAKIVETLGGVVTLQITQATHVINDGVKFNKDTLLLDSRVVVQRYKDMVQLHEIFHPFSSDKWVIEQQKFPHEPIKICNIDNIWYVDSRWLLDSEINFEWMVIYF
jgi:hypothetical protein